MSNEHFPELKTRRKWTFYLVLCVIVLFFWVIAGPALIVAGVKDDVSYIFLFLSLAAFLIGWLAIRFRFKITPIITVSDEGISSRDRTHRWAQIDKADLTGKQPYPGRDKPGMSTTLHFTDGTILIMHDERYTNAWEIKSYIEEHIPADRITQPESTPITTPYIQTGQTGCVKGRRYLTGYDNTLWGIVGMSIFFGYFIHHAMVIAVFAAIDILLAIILSRRINYFEVSELSFIVRKHYWSKYVREYPLSDILTIRFASDRHGGNYLSIMLHNYKTEKFPAAGLRGSDWIELIHILHKNGVMVIDEKNYQWWSRPAARSILRKTFTYIIAYAIIAFALFISISYVRASETIIIILKLLWGGYIFVGLLGFKRYATRLMKEDEANNKDLHK